MHFDSAIRPYSDVNFDVILGLTILKMRHYGENTKFLSLIHITRDPFCRSVVLFGN